MGDHFLVRTLVQSLRRGLVALAALFTAVCAAHADANTLNQGCEMPVLATGVPDGQIATEAEMLEAQAAVRYFDASITAYNFCLAEAELRQATLSPESAQALARERTELNNAAVQRAEQAAAAFNVQLAVFRNRGYQPAALRKPTTARDRAFCNRNNRRMTTINVDLNLSESGEVLEIVTPLGLGASDQAIVRCLVRRMTFDAALRDGMAEPGPLTLVIAIGGGDESLTASAGPPRFVISPDRTDGLEPLAALDRICTSPQPSGELRNPTIKNLVDLATNRSAVLSFDAALEAYALCLASAEVLLAERDPDHATALGDVPILRHEAAIELGEQIAGLSNRARLAYRSSALVPPVLSKLPLERSAIQCGRKIVVVSPPRWHSKDAYVLFPKTIVVRISAAGEIVGISYPPDTSSGNMRAMRCIVSIAKFSPAKLDGIAVAGSLPVSVSMPSNRTGMKVGPPAQSPVLVSRSESINAAFDQCIPGELREERDVRLVLTVGRSGRVEGVRTVISGGSDAIDRAASCIARKLNYEPGRYGGEKMRMEGVTLNLRIAPRIDELPPSTKPD